MMGKTHILGCLILVIFSVYLEVVFGGNGSSQASDMKRSTGGQSRTLTEDNEHSDPAATSYSFNIFWLDDRLPRGMFDLVYTGMPDICYEHLLYLTVKETPNHNFKRCSKYDPNECVPADCNWPAGNYCYMTSYACASGSRLGRIRFNGYKGSVDTNDVMTFCCRSNGAIQTPMVFPNVKPFSWFMENKHGCQQISGMRVRQRKVDLGKFLMTGVVPYLEGNTITLCDYVPLNMDCGGLIKLDHEKKSETFSSDQNGVSNKECIWIVEGPKDEDGTMTLHFQQFNFAYKGGQCLETVEIRHEHFEHESKLYCGDYLEKKFHSSEKRFWIRMITGSKSISSFTAHVTFESNFKDRESNCGQRKRNGFCEKHVEQAHKECASTCKRRRSTECSAIVNLSEKKTVFSFEPNKEKGECTWFIRQPKNQGAFVLEFDEMQLNDEDSLIVKTRGLASPGYSLSNENYPRSVVIMRDEIIIISNRKSLIQSNIQVKVTLKPRSMWCFNASDRGHSYAGKINYAESFKPCVPWKDTTSCPYNAYRELDVVNNLEEDYCRNPDGKDSRPWCYVNAKTCEKNHCDVCHWAKTTDNSLTCFDINNPEKGIQDLKGFLTCVTKCDEKASMTAVANKCREGCINEARQSVSSSDDKLREYCEGSLKDALLCAKTCRDYIKQGVFSVQCEIRGLKGVAVYNTGEKVKTRCSYNKQLQEEKMCLSDGRWAVIKSECPECPAGYQKLHGNCAIAFRNDGKALNEEQMELHCNEWGGNLYLPTNIDDTFDIINLVEKISNKPESVLSVTDFSTDDAFSTDYDIDWADNENVHGFACQAKLNKLSECSDTIDLCFKLLKDAEMCQKYPALKNVCPETCRSFGETSEQGGYLSEYRRNEENI